MTPNHGDAVTAIGVARGRRRMARALTCHPTRMHRFRAWSIRPRAVVAVQSWVIVSPICRDLVYDGHRHRSRGTLSCRSFSRPPEPKKSNFRSRSSDPWLCSPWCRRHQAPLEDLEFRPICRDWTRRQFFRMTANSSPLSTGRGQSRAMRSLTRAMPTVTTKRRLWFISEAIAGFSALPGIANRLRPGAISRGVSGRWPGLSCSVLLYRGDDG
jgi:hypothetical protein